MFTMAFVCEKKITEKRRVGNLGEELACRYLEKHGYKVVDRNFAAKIGEIDIIAENTAERVFSFIEVKSRNSLEFGLPCQAVSAAKQGRIRRTAELYLKTHKISKNFSISFDIIEILRMDGETFIRQLKNCF